LFSQPYFAYAWLEILLVFFIFLCDASWCLVSVCPLISLPF
jgi:hypothetical protein